VVLEFGLEIFRRAAEDFHDVAFHDDVSQDRLEVESAFSGVWTRVKVPKFMVDRPVEAVFIRTWST